MTKIITFTNMTGIELEKPEPASKNIPEWYKELPTYFGDGIKKPIRPDLTTSTIKKCIPVFDAISSGYIIKLGVDVYVEPQIDENGKPNPYFQWISLDAIGFHPIEQVPNHPSNKGHTVSYPKFINFWSVKTEPGYSCLFITPLHRDLPFEILPGVVDTDTYTEPVNFPFVLKDINFEGLIPAGTPIAQIIPFKRDSWKMEYGTESDIVQAHSTFAKVRTRFFEGYKTFYWNRKEYR